MPRSPSLHSNVLQFTVASLDVNLTDGKREDWEADIAAWRESIPKEDIQINKAWITVKSLIQESTQYYWQHGQCFGVSSYSLFFGHFSYQGTY